MLNRIKIAFIASTLLVVFSACEDSDSGSLASEGVSQGGSLARFAIANEHLYVVNDVALVPFDISNLDEINPLDPVNLGWDIETIFPYQQNLFIGSQSAVHIVSIEEPSSPEHLSSYFHSTGCDPVVVQGNYAYVTLKDGFSCNNPENLNVLDVVDVSDLSNPERIGRFNMTNPAGLGIGCNQKLYVCEGQFGLVQFDISNPTSPVREATYEDIVANDIIIRDHLMIVTGDDGIYQYDCSSGKPVALSKVDIFL